jgi:uncharacterized membrane protein YfcA
MSEILTTILFLILGFTAGILTGLLGIGGGMIFTPVLFYLFNYHEIPDSVKWTIGTSLFCGFSSAVSSIIPQLHKHQLFLKNALFLSLFGVFGTWIAQQIVNSGYYDRGAFSVLFSLVLFYMAWRFFQDNQQSVESKREHMAVDLTMKDYAFVGGMAGLVSSLVGIGGGIVVVPFLTLVYHHHIRTVTLTSTMVVILLAFSGWIQLALLEPSSPGLSQYSWGHVDFGAALPLVIGSAGGALFGVRIAQHVNRKRLQQLFGLLAILLGLKLWWDFL